MNLYAIAAALSWLASAGTVAPVRPIPLIVPDDLLRVSVNYPDVAGDYAVDPGGDITMIGLNHLHVAGLTTAQVAVLIRRDVILKCYYRPDVTVTVIGHTGLAATEERTRRR